MEDNLIQHWWNLQHYSHCAEWKAYMQKIRLRFPPLPAYFFECVLYNNFYHRNFFKLFLYIQLCVSSKCLCCVVWWMKSWMYEWNREMCSKGQSLKKGYFFFFKTHPSNHPYIHYLAFLWKWFFMKSSFAIQETINPKEQITS